MMENYALIDSSGNVVNTVVWDGTPFTPATDSEPATGWSPPDGQLAVPIPPGSQAGIGWTYDDGTFVSPPVPPPTAADILAANTTMRAQLLAAANLVVPALQDAVDLGDASADPALLKAWKQFRVDVNKIDVTKSDPNWPKPPQTGYGAAVAPVEQAS